MSTIVTRTGKGAALTWAEADANFTNLNNDKAELASPTFTGTPAAPTATTGTNTTQLATTAFVQGKTATQTPFTATGNIVATNVQTAIAELDTEKVAKAGDTMTGDLVVPSMNGGPLAGFRNKVINGGFDVWQRGAGPFTATGKCADMWNISWDGTGGTRSVTRISHAAGEEIEGQFYYLRWTQTNAGTATLNSLEGQIEYVRTLNGKQVTLSFWAKADAARTLNCFIWQNFGSGGSADVDTTTTNFSLTTAWQKFTYTFNMPSVSGKTIGTDNKLRLIFGMPLTTFTIDITNVQLEAGPVATPFESRSIGVETLLCCRYLVAITPNAGLYYHVLRRGTSNEVIISTPALLRSTPIISSYPATSYGSFAGYNISGSSVSSGAGTGITTATVVGSNVMLNIGYAGWAGTEVHCGWAMTTNTMLISAEL